MMAVLDFQEALEQGSLFAGTKPCESTCASR